MFGRCILLKSTDFIDAALEFSLAHGPWLFIDTSSLCDPAVLSDIAMFSLGS